MVVLLFLGTDDLVRLERVKEQIARDAQTSNQATVSADGHKGTQRDKKSAQPCRLDAAWFVLGP
jgi:hypothetical protein